MKRNGLIPRYTAFFATVTLKQSHCFTSSRIGASQALDGRLGLRQVRLEGHPDPHTDLHTVKTEVIAGNAR